eukprot:Blabericola_migrator_1__1266@NODE_1328_length_4787_cov_239_438771_g634_i1_p3_GENE_NODE_1328_length_4787_cov_239_438771_g634_i1NODE_1328_length_4787_cov_239_438771_g634_i1_p3_ORF_typecomplete_len186_score27_13_NODE_1328_length_4787_cov_239_438771_g634_i141304687
MRWVCCQGSRTRLRLFGVAFLTATNPLTSQLLDAGHTHQRGGPYHSIGDLLKERCPLEVVTDDDGAMHMKSIGRQLILRLNDRQQVQIAIQKGSIVTEDGSGRSVITSPSGIKQEIKGPIYFLGTSDDCSLVVSLDKPTKRRQLEKFKQEEGYVYVDAHDGVHCRVEASTLDDVSRAFKPVSFQR